MNNAAFSDLVGVTLTEVVGANDSSERVRFVAADGREWNMFHDQNCCESVRLIDVAGEIEDLIGSPIVMAEESSNEAPVDDALVHESGTWTFYKLATVKGYVTLRWLGTSNGYYSERVDFELASAPTEVV